MPSIQRRDEGRRGSANHVHYDLDSFEVLRDVRFRPLAGDGELRYAEDDR